MQYVGMCTVDDTALVWFISGNQYQTHYYLPMEVEIKGEAEYAYVRTYKTDVSFHGYCCFELESWVCLYCEQSKLCFCKITDGSRYTEEMIEKMPIRMCSIVHLSHRSTFLLMLKEMNLTETSATSNLKGRQLR